MGMLAALAGVTFGAIASVGQCLGSAWDGSVWLSVPSAPVFEGTVVPGSRSAVGTSWFVSTFTNKKAVVSARWLTAGLGVYEIYVNGHRIDRHFLKPGYTHYAKTKYSFSYDVTGVLKTDAGAENTLAAEVSSGWWRDKIVTPEGHKGFMGRKSAFRCVLELKYTDGTMVRHGSKVSDWTAGVVGPVKWASIFEGERFDARARPGYADVACFERPEENTEFAGEVLPTDGAEVYLRKDLTLKPTRAYVWSRVADDTDGAYGHVQVRRELQLCECWDLGPDETLVVDFGQNAAAVPTFEFSAAEGTELTALPAEMLNDGNGQRARGNDGPEGSVYRANLCPDDPKGRRIEYVFSGGGWESYVPRFTYFGYRYLSVTASAPLRIRRLVSVPVSSIRADQERGRLETGVPAVNKLIENIRWGQLSNYLSIPTDCPQRCERLGWAADTQIFSEAASFNADVYDFLRKWMRDERDGQMEDGSFRSVAPFGQYGQSGHRVGWADAGVIVPYVMWRQYGDTRIVRENYAAMARFLAMQDATESRTPDPGFQYADWLSFEDYEPCSGRAYEKDSKGKDVVRKDARMYWDFLAGCYWLNNARMMSEMAMSIGRADDAVRYADMAGRALAYVRRNFVDPEDGLLIRSFRQLQGAALFALKFGVLERPEAVAATKESLQRNFDAHDGCLTTGFLGTSILMDALTENGMVERAYSLLLNRHFPSWLYSVDQGATTVWERWNSYTKKAGFGPVDMNSFNHYAYGAVLAWIYKTVAGIASDPKAPGFKNVIMAPNPDRRMGFVKAEYQSAAGVIRSEWHYEGDEWVWQFEIPFGATADVTIPGEKTPQRFGSGAYVARDGRITRINLAKKAVPQMNEPWWTDRHERILAEIGSGRINPRVVLLGDSITHYWAGWNSLGGMDDASTKPRWRTAFARYGWSVLNAGFSGDQTQHLLWRIQNGELDNISPELVVLMIGVNNVWPVGRRRVFSPEETVESIRAILDEIHQRQHQARILLMSVLPAKEPGSQIRRDIQRINRLLTTISPSDYDNRVSCLDIGDLFLNANGEISRALLGDTVHPTDAGYAIWENALGTSLGDVDKKEK